MPFFSIIIPAYNRADFLPETLASVQAQTFTDWECIVVDDGSTDHTATVMQKLCADDPRIRYIYQQNAERSAARNNGIAHARGQYICFLDSDDRYLPSCLEDWHAFWQSLGFPEAFGYCDAIRVYESEQTTMITPLSGMPPMSFFFSNPIIPARICIKKELLDSHRFRTDCIVVEDACLWMELAYAFPVYYSPHTGAEYLIHEGNSVNPKNPAAYRMYEGLKRFFIARPDIRKAIPDALYRDCVSRIITNMAKFDYRSGRKFLAVKNLLRALFLCPFHRHTQYRIRLLLLTPFSQNPNLYE